MGKAHAAADAARVEVRSRSDLRAWLARHHATSASVWLVTWKTGTPHCLSFRHYVEELLCWGWIDSVPRKVDHTRSSTLISPRKPGSGWSADNNDLVETARAAGAMMPAGEAAIKRAIKSGAWTFLDDVEALLLPEDLAHALGSDVETWRAWPRSLKRAWLEQIKRARMPSTRKRRIAACRDDARANTPRAGLS